jgi:ATP phosphoribosyltransferase regulatory subunit
MSSAWLLPEHIADVLPAHARHIEGLRRSLLDVAARYGYELVVPPLLEHIESLLSGTGRELSLQTFKLVDQLSGRTLGVRADSTPQVARIDAHLLNRAGVARLCYCGPVLHTRAAALHSTREPLQFGAEVYGNKGLEADLEIQDLALACLQRVALGSIALDLGDARIARGLLEGAGLPAARIADVYEALATKDAAALGALSDGLPEAVRQGLQTLVALYGGSEVIAAARRALPERPAITAALDDLAWLAARAAEAHPGIRIGFDLADLGVYGYYSGTRFAIYAEGSSDAVARGGRYDEVGAVFGRNRPAVGFSLDLKDLAALLPLGPSCPAIRAPWSVDPALREAIRSLREAGETVVCEPPGQPSEGQEYAFDRELVQQQGRWLVREL